jgi:hypothetical protein
VNCCSTPNALSRRPISARRVAGVFRSAKCPIWVTSINRKPAIRLFRNLTACTEGRKWPKASEPELPSRNAISADAQQQPLAGPCVTSLSIRQCSDLLRQSGRLVRHLANQIAVGFLLQLLNPGKLRLTFFPLAHCLVEAPQAVMSVGLGGIKLHSSL